MFELLQKKRIKDRRGRERHTEPERERNEKVTEDIDSVFDGSKRDRGRDAGGGECQKMGELFIEIEHSVCPFIFFHAKCEKNILIVSSGKCWDTSVLRLG